MYDERPCACGNVLLACGTLFVLLLTCLEIAMPIATLVVTALMLAEQVANPFFGGNELLLFIGTIGSVASSALLLVIFLCQFYRPFNKGVASLRHILNLAFTAFAILLLLYVRTSTEGDVQARIDREWGNVDSTEFQRAYECVSQADCIVPLRKSFERIYDNGRMLRPILGLFWAAIIFYGIVGIIIVGASKAIKLV